MHAVLPAPTLRLLWWLPRLAFLLFIAAVIALLWFWQKSEQEDQRATLISDVLWLEQNLHFHLSHNEELLGRLDPQRIHQPDIFDAHAQTLLASKTGLRQILWLDQLGTIQFSLPPVTTLPEQQHSLPDPTVNRLASSMGRAVYGATYPGAADDWQFEVHVPVFRTGKLAGMAVGIYSIDRLLEDSVPWWLAERYRISITDQSGRILGSRSKVMETQSGRDYQIPFEPPGRGLILQAIPYQTPQPLAGRLITAALVFLAMLVLFSLWALRRDAQRRLAAESALRNEVAFRKAMEDSLQTGLRARNLQGRITYVNPAFCRMVGWSAEELIDHPPPMPYWAEEYLDETRQMHDRVMAGEAPLTGFEMKFRRRNGEIFSALIHEAPLIDSQGLQTGWMGSVIDITERQRAAELAHQQEQRLQASARLITMGEMASSLAHELNQPLSAIAGYVAGCRNLLTSGAHREEISEALGKCQEQAQRAGRIIRRIYEFARRHEPKSEPCAIDALLSDLIALIEADARRQKIRITRDIAPDLPPICGDHILLGQTILNLLRNAIEAMRETDPEQRNLKIAAHATNQQLLIAITDTGCGFDSAAASQLFEPFYTTKSEGLGVGLNICRSVVEAHQGRLWFDSQPQQGSTFYISLPLCPSTPCP
jgi:two-component system sensor histidine kinase DctS